MTGGTHIAIGIASALLVTQPRTIPETLCAITGGMVGGMICDLDSPKKKDSFDYRNDPYAWQVYTFAVLAIAGLLAIDYFSGNGAVDYVISNFGPLMIGSIVLFIGLCIFGMNTAHRTFMHSILAGGLLTASIWFFCRPLAIPFGIGFASHIIIDFFNKRKIQYFWPIPVSIGLNKFPSDGKLNDFFCGIGTICSIFAASFFFVKSFSSSALLTKLIGFFSKPVSIFGILTVPLVIPYLFIINLIAFVVYLIDSYSYINGKGFYGGTAEHADTMAEFIMTLLLAIDFAGGMIGKLIVVFIVTKGVLRKAEAIANYNLFVIPICALGCWLSAACTFFIPAISGRLQPVRSMEIGSAPIFYVVLGYLVLINIVTMVMFPKVQQFAKAITPRERVCMLLSLIGGAAGGYLSMSVTGKHQNAVMFADTLPEMMIMHAVVVSCLFFA